MRRSEASLLILMTCLAIVTVAKVREFKQEIRMLEASVAALEVTNADLRHYIEERQCAPRFDINDVINALSSRGLSPRAQEIMDMSDEEYEAEKARLGVD